MKRLTCLAAAVLLAAGPLRAAEPITLDLVDAEIEAVARTMAVITGRSIVVDSRVKGKLTLSTDRPIAPAAAFDQFVAALRVAGYAVVDAAGLLEVVPEADAKLQGGKVAVDAPVRGNQVATRIFRLNFESAGNLVPVLRPLISPNNTVNVDPGTNALVITDYADNLERLALIVAALDVPNATQVEVIRLQHALAPDLAPIVQKLLDAAGSGAATAAQGQGGQADGGFRTTVIAEPRSNALLVRAANPARLNLLRTLVAQLDQADTGPAAGNIYVVYLRNAEASRLATVLRAALAGMASGAAPASMGAVGPTASAGGPAATAMAGASASATSSAATAAVQAAAQPSTGGQIQADPATNALIITAAEPQYRQLRAVIDQLDGRRAQVLVESLIVEVNDDKSAEFGVQWQNLLGGTSSSVVGYAGTNYSTGGTNIISLNTSAGSTLPSTGLNIGIGRKVGDTYVLGLLARFFESSGGANVLSKPTLLTLDNEEARIVIGQNVPFVTGSYTTTTSSSSTVSPFQTIERKDVGLTLRVRPQISESGTVRLTVFQEVSSVDASTATNINGPTTNKRTIESTVLVEDGGVVVLGGLLQDEYSGTHEGVPGMSRLPVIGSLFRSETRDRKKTNLMVFLRPVVLRDAGQTQALSLDRYELMQREQQAMQPAHSALVPVDGAAVLPAVGH